MQCVLGVTSAFTSLARLDHSVNSTTEMTPLNSATVMLIFGEYSDTGTV